MAVEFAPQRETSTGPLDVAKNAGGDNVGFLSGSGVSSGDDSPLDGSTAPQTEEELLQRKNPFGYSITLPTEAEIEEGDSVYANSADKK